MKLTNFVSNTFGSVVLMTLAAVPGSALARSAYLQTSTVFSEQTASNTDTSVVLVPCGLGNVRLDAGTQPSVDQVSCAMAAQDFTGAGAQQMELPGPTSFSVDRLELVGAGQPAALSRHHAETMETAMSVRIIGSKAAVVEVDTQLIGDTGLAARIAAEIAHGGRSAQLRDYTTTRLCNYATMQLHACATTQGATGHGARLPAAWAKLFADQ